MSEMKFTEMICHKNFGPIYFYIVLLILPPQSYPNNITFYKSTNVSLLSLRYLNNPERKYST